MYSDTQVRDRICISDNEFIRSSDVPLAEFIADVDGGYFRRDSRQFNVLPFPTCPCRYTTHLWAVRNQGECPSAEKLWPSYSMSSYTPIRKCWIVVVFRTTSLYGEAMSLLPNSSQMLTEAAMEKTVSRGRARWLVQDRDDPAPDLSFLVLASSLLTVSRK